MKTLLALVLAAVAQVVCAAVPDGAPVAPATKFTWGASAGASIDMSGNDMSSVDFDISFGLRRGWINFLGVGLEADIMVSNSCRSFPLFAEFRSNFVNRPTIVFWDLKAGVCLNYLENDHQQTGFYGFTGVGFNLARSAKFSSHILIGYTFRERRNVFTDAGDQKFPDLHYATVKIGVSF